MAFSEIEKKVLDTIDKNSEKIIVVGKKVLENAQMIQNSDGTFSFVPNENIFLTALIIAVLVIPFYLCLKEKKNEDCNN